MNHIVGLAGIALLIGGVAAIYWPAALIVAGLILVKAYRNLEKTDTNARKPK